MSGETALAVRLGDYLAACMVDRPAHCPAFARGWLLRLGMRDAAPWAEESLGSIMARARAAGGVRRLASQVACAFGCAPVSGPPRLGDVGLVMWRVDMHRRRFGFAIRCSLGWAMLGASERRAVAVTQTNAVRVWRPYA